MTITIDAPAEIPSDVEDVEDNADMDSNTTRSRERDFTKFRPSHQELADYVNQHSGLDPITPNQVKAILALRVDFNKLPEQMAQREERKAIREAEKSKYEGLSPEQVKAQRAADRAEKQAEKLQARVAEAKAKAEALRSSITASGEDLAAAVEAAQAEEPTPTMMEVSEPEGKSSRRIGRRR